MVFGRTIKRLIAQLALGAMLFSALSPAMAGVLFSHRPDILARVLGAPTKPSPVTQTEICHQEPQDGNQANLHHQTDKNSDHDAHGIYCSFCLASSSVVTVPTMVSAPALTIILAAVFLPAGRIQPPAAQLAATRHPRDPPAALR